ncbi:hypothetical protein [uncultured Clostridium sp.]|nr:hypothetical protein [uncultured Clostridium sp.]
MTYPADECKPGGYLKSDISDGISTVTAIKEIIFMVEQLMR